MGRKVGKYNKKESYPPKKRAIHDEEEEEDMMNDEIDAFHKQRDIIPLDVNEGAEESDEGDEYPVFDLEADKGDDEDDTDDEEDDDIEDDTQLTGLAAKIVRQQKYLHAKMGGVEDEMDDDTEDKEGKRSVWGRNKNLYYNAENVDYELQSSDEEDPAEEEREILRLQKEKAQSMTAADFGDEDVSENESDREPTFEELVKGKPKISASKEAKDDPGTAYEEVKKDLNSLTTEEKMDVVYSSAPELVGLLSELNDAFEQLENKVNPLLSKIGKIEKGKNGATQYMEVKQLLLLSYCQAITFYLLLKSEGQPVRDHPVISRLVEIKNLLDKMKELDGHLPPKLEDILNEDKSDERVEMEVEEHNAITACSLREAFKPSVESFEKTEMQKVLKASELVEDDSLKAYKDKKTSKLKHQDKEVGPQSLEMLKVRAALEEKLKQKGIFSSILQKQNRIKKRSLPVNGQLETWDDFDDDTKDGNLLRPSKLSKLVPQANKAKDTAGDDDLPKRDDIGERRRKHELRVLAGAGIKSVDGVEDETGALSSDGVADEDLDAESDSDLEFYKQVKQEHAAKLTAKAEMYSRPTKVPSMPDTLVDGKRQITYQMEKNRGLTRNRNKLTKNPRKKYRTKHQKAVVRRKGQVRDIKKPSGPYGGESSGINTGISRSIRFKN